MKFVDFSVVLYSLSILTFDVEYGGCGPDNNLLLDDDLGQFHFKDLCSAFFFFFLGDALQKATDSVI